MNSLIDDRAMLDDEEDDESYDEATGEIKSRRNGAPKDFNDSSEEDEDEDDEEAAAEVAEGFIDDDEEQDNQIARRDRKRARREERKRKRQEEAEDEDLDEEDLELIGRKPVSEPTEPKFKRLKRGPREAERERTGGIGDIFASDDEEDIGDYAPRPRQSGRRGDDEMEGFIEEDVFSDEDDQRREDEEVARPARRGMVDLGAADAAGLDPQAIEDFRAAFGDGHDYDFALDMEDDADAEEAERDRHLTLKDVFEPSQLAEKMLLDDDMEIVRIDEPERHQIARKPYKHVELTEDEFKEEAVWISKLLLQKTKTHISLDLREPFEKCVKEVLDFMVTQDYEVPFILANRKDYLIHVSQKVVGRKEDGSPDVVPQPERMLEGKDLWEIFDLDLKFRALIEKRQALQKTYENLKSTNIPPDTMFEQLLPAAETVEELQDLSDYLHFQYASQLKDLALTSQSETNGTNGVAISQKRAATKSIYEEIRASKAYGLVRAFGITANAFAQNAAKVGVRTYTDDSLESIENLADTMVDDDFQTGSGVVKAAKAMFVEELVSNPEFRKLVRRTLYVHGVVDCHRTDKGLRKIDEQHPYYEFKYLRNQDFRVFVDNPAMYLKMLKAEEEGLVDVKIRLSNHEQFKKQLYKYIETDNYSTAADAWNRERREVVAAALDKVIVVLARLAKANLKTECEEVILKDCREEFQDRLDQAPYQPRGMKKGTTPRALALSNGKGIPGRDPICFAYVNDDGRVVETGKFVELAPGDRERGLPDGRDVAALVDLIKRRDIEVIGVSGESPEARKLQNHLTTLVKDHDLRGQTYEDEDGRDRSDLLDVVLVNDEVARLYKTSDKAKADNPGFSPLTHYCVALAKYLQDPMKQYASLGRDITSINFDPAQNLVDQGKLLKKLETALVDTVNMVGVEIDEALVDQSLANLLLYVAGLGPRKAAHMLKTIHLNGGKVSSRPELLGLLPEGELAHQPLTQRVWQNSASFMNIPWDPQEDTAEYLDGTRIHPDDYDIARKMAADALELDEEDIEEETKAGGPAAILRRLIKQDAQDRVNDLVLEEYAEQLEKKLDAKKRSTLENIRAEIQEPYEELRRDFRDRLSGGQVFTMLTGETKDSIDKGMNVPVTLKRITDSYVEGLLDCGMVAVVEEGAWTDLTDSMGLPRSPKQLFTLHQTVQAHITDVKPNEFSVTVSLKDDQLKKPYKRFDPKRLGYDEWDDKEEGKDRKLLEEKSDIAGRTTRVVKHPLFKPFNSKQAEEYLASQSRGDVVIRPSSKGTDHLAVTWKVADGVFQHIDVLELGKENEFALGKTLRIGGNQGSAKYTYSDLDELIVMHVKAMARKVEEMVANDKYQDKTKSQLEDWLATYCAANPKRSMYQFCLNREKPGFFHLSFKAGQKAKLMDWQVKIIPNGFQLNNQPYPSMAALSNGFKMMFNNARDTQHALRR